MSEPEHHDHGAEPVAVQSAGPAPPRRRRPRQRAHGHAHGGVDAAILGSREAMRTLGRSLVILGLTAAFQVVVVVLSGSIALLADTVHNAGDALTAVPLAVAFVLGRRDPDPSADLRLRARGGLRRHRRSCSSSCSRPPSPPTRRSTASSTRRHPPTCWLTALAGLIGFAGNEWVAVYRIRTGRRIGSVALEADGYHARIDGFTSLAVVAGVIGVAAGFRLADPIVGLLISVAILRIVWQSAREIGLRALDGVDPEIVDRVREEAANVPGVLGVGDVRARWLGHIVRAEVTVAVDPDRRVGDGDAIADTVERSG